MSGLASASGGGRHIVPGAEFCGADGSATLPHCPAEFACPGLPRPRLVRVFGRGSPLELACALRSVALRLHVDE